MAIGLSEIINNSSKAAGLSEDFAEKFRLKILKNENVLKEYIHFIKTGNFLCQYKVCDMSIADIMVYQIDYFKSAMDQDRLDMKFNPDKMLLLAVDKMLDMDEDKQIGEKFKQRLLSESGTDGTEMGTKRI